MSTHNLYRVHDRIAECDLGPIMLELRDGPAMRTFSAVLADKNTIIGQNPGDYELRFLGTIADETSIITPCRNGPKVIMTGASWVELHSASRERSQGQVGPQGIATFSAAEETELRGR